MKNDGFNLSLILQVVETQGSSIAGGCTLHRAGIDCSVVPTWKTYSDHATRLSDRIGIMGA